MATPVQTTASLGYDDRFSAQVRSRRTNAGAVIENPLAHLTDRELEEDVKQFSEKHLPSVKYEDILRAARVAKDIRLYDEIARRPDFDVRNRLPVNLSDEEKRALRRERDVAFSEKGMVIVIATVSLAALLQGNSPLSSPLLFRVAMLTVNSSGFVQSSFNGASIYSTEWGLTSTSHAGTMNDDDWRLGVANASPWFIAALFGCPLSLPINYWFGRRGGVSVAAFLIFGSSIGAVFATTWIELSCVRIFNGLGAWESRLSAPRSLPPRLQSVSGVAQPFLLGSSGKPYDSLAIDFHKLTGMHRVAFGIMMGFVFNMIFTNAGSDRTTLALIQGAPMVPSLALLIMALRFCPESPRYHLMKGPNYGVEKAYRILQRLRNTEIADFASLQLQALRDLYVVYKAIEQENMGIGDLDDNATLSPGFFWVIRDFFLQFKQLFQQRRLYNAVMATSTVNLAQQFCGVNVCAFYSGTLFNRVGAGTTLISIAYSIGFGAINFLFALPAVKSIDTLGRRKWLMATLPFMALFMLGAAMSSFIQDQDTRIGVTACFLFLFAVVYSPGLGPIPFTLASESFPLTHREAGTAWAISINFFFAGLLAILFPNINSALGQAGSLGLFSALNIVALVMVFLFVEETKRRSLEELDHIFAVSKREFISFQVTKYLPWFVKRCLLGGHEAAPELYQDLVWGPEEVHEILRQPDELDAREAGPTMAGRHSPTIKQQPPMVQTECSPHAVEIGDSRTLYPQAPLASHPSGYDRTQAL
ncbi:Putative polyol transporter 2 [Tolypocladium paradoxum]|uniref:Polyol transporter 2 n=1 Tax=Tolypocladium paradoxum TaxID=94208 RepID=A0A2S4KLR0_9HYPO|nr:Putative polyol transporter 2 [Tolypocladium paradoxum]